MGKAFRIKSAICRVGEKVADLEIGFSFIDSKPPIMVKGLIYYENDDGTRWVNVELDNGYILRLFNVDMVLFNE